MKTRLTIVFAILLVGAIVTSASAFTGSLTSTNGGLQGTGFWPSEGTTLTWTVTFDDTNNWWNYTYNLVVPRADISHFLVEVSDSFTQNDILGATGPFTGTQIGDFNSANGNPRPGSGQSSRLPDATIPVPAEAGENIKNAAGGRSAASRPFFLCRQCHSLENHGSVNQRKWLS